MLAILAKVWFLVFMLPFTIAREGWGKFKPWMDKDKSRWEKLLYAVLIFLIIMLLMLLADGYRY